MGPKVIDFGIAKATLGRLADRTVFTTFEQFIGTPAYVIPEQATSLASRRAGRIPPDQGAAPVPTASLWRLERPSR